VGVKKQCDGLLSLIHDAMQGLEELSKFHTEIEEKTSVLHMETEALLKEKQHLSEMADLIHSQLSHYKTLDVAAATLHHSHVSVQDPLFFECLTNLDEALKFVRAHPMYQGADKHLLRFGQLQQRGLVLLKDHIVAQLRQAAAQIMVKYAEKDGALQA
jgi:hypothetical protein